jgi:PTH1 family peptidyl-tRNA hydrolase
MAVVVGLGNPGWRYRRTRHNIGFHVVEEMAWRARVRFRRSYRMAARIAQLEYAGCQAVLVEPQTYMNRSGLTVRAVMVEFDRRREELVVVVDDVALPLGRLRVRPEGSDGGHNGLRSIVEALGSTEFARVRVGVGRAQSDGLTGHVLGRFTRGERPLVAKVIEAAADAVETAVREGVGAAMNAFNGMDLAAAEPSGAVEE